MHIVLGGVMLFPAPAATGPDAAFVETVKVNGSGCRKGTAAVAMSPDKAAFTVTYSEYVAAAGTGAKAPDRSRKCSVTVRIGVPPNVAVAVSAVDHRGFAHVEDGASAVLATRHHVPGEGAPRWAEHALRGFRSGDWQVTEPATGTFGPCGKDRKFDLDTELRVDADPAAPLSMITVDSTDGAVTSTYRLHWRGCAG